MKIYKQTNEENKFLKMEIDYEKWGMNYFSWWVNRRWIYLYFRTVERTQMDGYTTESFTVFGDDSSFKILLEETARLNQKKLDLYWQKAIENKDELFDACLTKDIEKIKSFFTL